MKRYLLRAIMAFIAIITSFPLSARDFKYTYEGQTLTYTVLDEDAKTVETKAGYIAEDGAGNKISGDLIIPEFAVDGDTKYSVVAIGKFAFYKCSYLNSVNIPNSVTTIRDSAFCECSNLTSITIPNSVTTIGNSAFCWCSSLTSVDIPISVTAIGSCTFYECISLTSVTIPDSLPALAPTAFYECIRLTSVTNPDSVTAIGDSAFSNCSSLTSVTIPNSVTSINTSAFADCTSLSSVILRNSITFISKDAFKNCSNLVKSAYPNTISNPFSTGIAIAYNPNKAIIEDGVIYESGSRLLFVPCDIKEEYLIPETIKSIGEYAFAYCKGLTSVGLPNSASTIGEYAFKGCTGLSEVSLPASVSALGDYAFQDCSALTRFRMEDGSQPLSLGTTDGKSHIFANAPLKTLHVGRDMVWNYEATSPFEAMESLDEVTFGNSIGSLPDRCFRQCTNIKSVELPESLKSIGDNAFALCNHLTDIDLPGGLTYIGRYAFGECGGLTSITIPGSVTTIEVNAFAYTGLKEVRTGIYSLPDNIGLQNDILVTLLPDTDNRFVGISSNNLQHFKKIRACKDSMMYGLVKASDKLIFSNTGYQEADIALVALDQSSLTRCSDNTSVVLFDGKDITEAVLSDNGYEFRPSLLHEENIFTVYGGATGDRITMDITLKSPGTLFNEIGLNNIDKVEVLSVRGNINGTDVMTINRMPALRVLDISRANIFAGATTYREDLKTKTDVVGTQFFYNTSLESVKLPASAKEIADDAFANLKTLRTLKLGNHISKIGKGAFNGCQKLQDLNIPGSVNSIGANAFTACVALSSLNIEDGESDLTLADLSFRTSPLKEVYWGRNLKYNSAKKPFEDCVSLSSVTVGDNITALLDSEFKGCVNLKTVTGCMNVKAIGKEAFMNCSSLEGITLPGELATIEASVFNSCRSLTDIYLPDNITSIGNLAFRGTALTEIRIPEKVRFIGESAFSGCGELKSVYSYNLTPPEISSTTFDTQTESVAELKVIEEAMVHYWLDPVWQEFGKLSGNLLYMKEIEDMTYGDPEFDLSQYGSAGGDVAYMTTTPDVINIEGSIAKISGAGNAEIWIIPASDGSEKEPHRRTFRIEKKNLIFEKSKDYLIFEGQAFRSPEPVLSEGLAYGDKIEDIEKLPEFTCVDGEYPVAGIYDIAVSGGTDRNYTFSSPKSILVVAGPETTVDFRRTSPFYISESTEVEGILEIQLDQATYNNRQHSKIESLSFDINVTFGCGDYRQEDVITCGSILSHEFAWNITENIPTNEKVDYKIVINPDSYREREYEFNGSVWKFSDSDLFPSNVLVESVEESINGFPVRNRCLREYISANYPITNKGGNIIPVCCYLNTKIKFMEYDNSNYYSDLLGTYFTPDLYFNRKQMRTVDFKYLVDYLRSGITKRNFFSTGIEVIRQDESEDGIVNIEFSVTPAASVNEIPVNMALILTQDNIHGVTNKYQMNNSHFSGMTWNKTGINMPEDMRPFAEWYFQKPKIIPASDLIYNDVVRFILPAEGTIASDWTAKVPVKGTFSFKLPDNPEDNLGTMDPENLNFIIVATDAVTGECVASNIVNWGEYLGKYNGAGNMHLSLDTEGLRLTEGQSEILTPIIVKNEDVGIESEKWFTSDSSVATVENGVVTAISKGTATIAYQLIDSYGHEHIATCRLTVNETVGLDSINSEDSDEIMIFTTEGLQLKSTLKDLAPGIYIVRRGNEVRKIKVK